MRCMSCGADIPPQWVAAINSNKCPGCNCEIMDSKSQELLHELSEAMEKMPKDPQGVAGWLMSNYRFQKIGTGEPVEKFHRKGGNRPEDVDSSNLKTDPTYNEFIKRNNASELVARGAELEKRFKGKKGDEKFAEMAKAIQQVGDDPYGDGSSDVDITEEESWSPPDIEEQKAYSEMKSSGFDPFAGDDVGGIGSGMVGDPNTISALAKIMGQGARTSEDASVKEALLEQTPEGKNYLQRDRFKKLKAQDAVSGGGGGVFRR